VIVGLPFDRELEEALGIGHEDDVWTDKIEAQGFEYTPGDISDNHDRIIGKILAYSSSDDYFPNQSYQLDEISKSPAIQDLLKRAGKEAKDLVLFIGTNYS
jgi:hypothetical protein